MTGFDEGFQLKRIGSRPTGAVGAEVVFAAADRILDEPRRIIKEEGPDR